MFSVDLILSSQATFVGNIVNVEIRSESTRSIRIEDGTGKITLNHMIQEAEEAEDPPRWRWLFHISRSSKSSETDHDML